MAFTIKHRSYESVSAPTDCVTAPGWSPIDTLVGEYDSITTHYENGSLVVCARHDDGRTPGYTFGPHETGPTAAHSAPPRPTIWVMNEAGATVAKYDL